MVSNFCCALVIARCYVALTSQANSSCRQSRLPTNLLQIGLTWPNGFSDRVLFRIRPLIPLSRMAQKAQPDPQSHRTGERVLTCASPTSRNPETMAHQPCLTTQTGFHHDPGKTGPVYQPFLMVMAAPADAADTRAPPTIAVPATTATINSVPPATLSRSSSESSVKLDGAGGWRSAECSRLPRV